MALAEGFCNWEGKTSALWGIVLFKARESGRGIRGGDIPDEAIRSGCLLGAH